MDDFDGSARLYLEYLKHKDEGTDYAGAERAAFLRSERDAGPRMLGLAILLAIQAIIWFALGWITRGLWI